MSVPFPDRPHEWRKGYQAGYVAARKGVGTKTTVRLVDGVWEYRCASCAAKGQQCFWPLTEEFWVPRQGMKRCRACYLEAKRKLEKARHKANDPLHLARCKAYREAYRDTINRMRRLEYAERRDSARRAGAAAWKREMRAQERAA